MRVNVWENFVERMPQDVGVLSPEAIVRLAEWQMNGREIKNVLNMSVSWCRKKKHQLTLGVVENLLTAIYPSAQRKDERPSDGINGKLDKSDVADEFSLLDM